MTSRTAAGDTGAPGAGATPPSSRQAEQRDATTSEVTRRDRPGKPSPGAGRAVPLAIPLVLLAAGCVGPPVPRPAEGPLTIALATPPLGLDPHRQNDRATQWVLANVYDALVALDREMRIVPALAERWESPDVRTWRFHLRPARFHDGRPVEAADVAASLERARGPGSRVSGYLAEVSGVRVVGPRTLEVETVRPHPILLAKLSVVAILSRDAPAEVRAPLGAGPYRFVAHEPGASVDLEAFDGYWRGAARLRRVRFRVVPDRAEQVAGLLSGALDVVPVLARDQVARLSGVRGLRLLSRPDVFVTVLGLRVSAPPFSDPRVRRAIHLGLDREALVKDLLGDQAAVASQLVTPLVFGYSPKVRAPKRDVAAARRLLARAGHAAGLRVALEHAVDPARAEAIAAQLAEIGVLVEPRPRPWGELYAALQARAVPFFMLGVGCDTADATDVFDSVLHSRSPAGGRGALNFTGYSSPRLDRLLESNSESRRATDRAALLAEAMDVVMADLPLVPLWANRITSAVRDDVAWAPGSDEVRAYEMARTERR